MNRILICILTAIAALPAFAQEEKRPIKSVYSVGTGYEKAYDDYLSPISYDGASLSLRGRWLKAMPANPRRLVMQFDGAITSGFLKSMAGAAMYDLGLQWSWGMKWRGNAGPVQIAGGGRLGLEAGALYAKVNGNNPVDARASVGLAIDASAAWATRIKGLPVLLSDEVSLPSLSAFFSQQYGQSYYEIYLGDRSGLVHAGWWGNHFGISNLLACDFDFGGAALRVGYRFEVGSRWANHINSQRTYHLVEIGIIPGGIGLRKKEPKTINPLYEP